MKAKISADALELLASLAHYYRFERVTRGQISKALSRRVFRAEKEADKAIRKARARGKK